MEFKFLRSDSDPNRIFIMQGQTAVLFNAQPLTNFLQTVLALDVSYTKMEDGRIAIEALQLGKSEPYYLDGEKFTTGYENLDAMRDALQTELNNIRAWYDEKFIEEKVLDFE